MIPVLHKSPLIPTCASPCLTLASSSFSTAAPLVTFPTMDGKRSRKVGEHCESQEVSSKKWERINMSDQEEDLIYRMYRLVGDRWGLIAGRIPGRKPEEIERFWIMRHGNVFCRKTNHRKLIPKVDKCQKIKKEKKKKSGIDT